MNDELSLFDMAEEEPAPSSSWAGIPPIRDDQITEVRQAFANAGIEDQSRRQKMIQEAVHRDVTSLSDLKATEVRHVLDRIASGESGAVPEGASSASAWDEREGDTWIDRL